jgi:hypothetical protein
MTSTYYDFNNSIALEFYNDADDREIIGIVKETLLAKAKTALDIDDYNSTVKFLKRLTAIKEHMEQMDTWEKRHEGESNE